MNYKFVNKGTVLNPIIYVYHNNEEIFIGGNVEMLTYLLHLPYNSDIDFENFSILQMIYIKESTHEFRKYESLIFEKTKDATHIMTHKDTQFIFLDQEDTKERIYEVALSFKEIDTIECRKFGRKKVITVSGTRERYGIKNEYGFYDIESNEFLSNDMINPEFDTYDTFENIYIKYKIKKKTN